MTKNYNEEANNCFERGLATKKASKGVDMDGGAVDDDFDIKQEFFKKRGAEGMNLAGILGDEYTMLTDTTWFPFI